VSDRILLGWMRLTCHVELATSDGPAIVPPMIVAALAGSASRSRSEPDAPAHMRLSMRSDALCLTLTRALDVLWSR
jgi:hypothetical protein